MLTQTPSPSLPWLRGAARRLATLMGRWALGEPATVLPTRNADRLSQLERRERWRQAERAGDDASLDADLARMQLNGDDLARLAAKSTPLADWPDEDVDALLGPTPGGGAPQDIGRA
jgi:hypothetical protein